MADKKITGRNRGRETRDAARQLDKRYQRKKSLVQQRESSTVTAAVRGAPIPGNIDLETPTVDSLNIFEISDPASSVATQTSVVDAYDGVLITTTAAGNAQTIGTPTTVGFRWFWILNNDTSTSSIDIVGSTTITLSRKESSIWFYDGSAWLLCGQGRTGGVGSNVWDGSATDVTLVDSSDRVLITQTSTTGNALKVIRDLASGSTNTHLVKFHNDNAGDDKAALWLVNDAPYYALFIESAGSGIYVNSGSLGASLTGDSSSGTLYLRASGNDTILLLSNSTGDQLKIYVPASFTNYTLTLPDAAPSTGHQLTAGPTATTLIWQRPGRNFGDATLGDTTYSSNQTFTEDRHFHDLTISSSSSINLAGYRLFCTGTLTIGAGSVVHCNGNAGTAGSTPSAAAAGGAALSRTAEFGGSGAGGAGGTGTGGADTGGAAGSAELTTPSLYPGICLTGSGGGGGAETFPVEAAPGANGTAGSTGLATTGGAGGNSVAGSAGAGDIGCSGGGGGSGGGVCYIAAHTISNSGTISANGGAGGNGLADAGIGQSGNGGGGGGGCVIVYSTSASSGTVQANGGAAGAGGNGGAAGSNGTVLWERVG